MGEFCYSSTRTVRSELSFSNVLTLHGSYGNEDGSFVGRIGLGFRTSKRGGIADLRRDCRTNRV